MNINLNMIYNYAIRHMSTGVLYTKIRNGNSKHTINCIHKILIQML